MRKIVKALSLGTLLLLTGCEKWSFLRKSDDSVRMPTGTPTTVSLVNYLNENARKIESLECHDIQMDARQGLRSIGLEAKLTCQRPRNFRMTADAMGAQQVDLGSNEREFWWWIARGDPYLIHCSYEDLNRGISAPLPFQPAWVMEALGMAEYGPPEKYRVAAFADRYELIEEPPAGQGLRVQKVTVFNRAASKFQVRAHLLRDAKGKEICSAHILDVYRLDGGIVVPKRVVLDCPGESFRTTMKLTLELNDVRVNRPIGPELTQSLFTRPTLSNVPSVDLAQRRYDPGSGPLQPAGGFPH